MANFSAYQRTKCQNSKKHSMLNLWNWCITIQFLVAIQLNFQCYNAEDSPMLSPGTPIFVSYGNPLEIFCMTDGSNYTSEDIVFKVNDQVIPSETVNSTTIRLYREKPEKQITTYICRNRKSKKNNMTRVLVDSPPEDVSDFSCMSKSLLFLNCSWNSPTNYSKINYSLFNIINGKVYKCNTSNVEGSWNAAWNTTSFPRYRQPDETFYFKLLSENVFGKNEQNFTIDHFSIVKPDPPHDLKVVKNGTHSVVLKWYIPTELVDFSPGVYHRIEYQIAKIDNTNYFRTVNTSNIPSKPGRPNIDTENVPYEYEIQLPYAYMQYDIRIYIKTLKATKEEFWSDFTFIVVHTLGERPKKPPEMAVGGFHQSIYRTYRVINVYWKQIELYEEAGANFTYRAEVEQRNKTSTIYPDKNKSMSYISLNEASLDPIKVTVWSQNDNGSSYKSSHLYIPSHLNSSLGVTSFTKLAYENGTYELTWVNKNKLDNYTVFWCQYNTTKICNGRMNYTTVNGTETTYSINLSKEYRYQFALSANVGARSSGMVWARCDISKDGLALFQFPMHLYYDAPGETFVKLRWNMECVFRDGIITGYEIKYCPIIRTSSLCDPAVKNQSKVISNPKEMEINITQLLSSRTYQFSIALKTKNGIKNIENTTAVVTTLEDRPTNPRNIMVTDVKNNSFVVSWDPPEHRNGKVGQYLIYNFNKILKEVNEGTTEAGITETDTRHIEKLTNLDSFKNYSITVQACNIAIGRCSQTAPRNPIVVKTLLGRPSKQKAPILLKNPESIIWEPPETAGGLLEMYQIRAVKDGTKEEIINTTNLSYLITRCSNGNLEETYQVRGVNFDESDNNTMTEYPGEWSDPLNINCDKGKEGLTTFYIIMGVISILAIIYGSVKLSKWKLDRDDLKPPKFPDTLRISEKDAPKYTSSFGGWSPTNKEDKPSSDEMLLLPGNKTAVSTPDIKNNDTENCAASDHTDSTGLSDSSRAPTERQPSMSEDSTNSSLHSDADGKDDENRIIQDEGILDSDTSSSPENSLYVSDKNFKKNPATGYVQPVVNAANGYVQSGVAPNLQAPSSSYVMSGLSPPIFTTGVAPIGVSSNTRPSAGYVRAEDVQARSINLPQLGPSPTKIFGPESLPSMSPLPLPSKRDDIQLQSLDSSLKPSVRNALPIKPQRAGGYVCPGDPVLNKHLSNMLSPGIEDDPALLDPTMSPDAYCRFSWSTDPANDNLHSLFTDSTTKN